MRLALLLLLSITAGLAGSLEPTWKTFHRDDPELLGVRVQQVPDSNDQKKKYLAGHPALVLYVFRDHRVHQLGFTPDGKVKEDFWWKLTDRDKYILETLQPLK